MNSLFNLCQCLTCITETRYVLTSWFTCESCKQKKKKHVCHHKNEKQLNGMFKLTPVNALYFQIEQIDGLRQHEASDLQTH